MNSETLLDTIPSLDLADFLSGDAERRAKFVQELGSAFNNIGFVAIKNHGLTDELTAKLYEVVQKFFYSDDELKFKYVVPGIAGQRGYVAKGKETAKGFKVADLKEFYHIGQPKIDDGDPIWAEYSDNVFLQNNLNLSNTPWRLTIRFR
jgi:isopenicillin N synthase-like dioxygenase